MNTVKIYVLLNEQINQYIIMIIDQDVPFHSEIVKLPFLQSTVDNYVLSYKNMGKNVTVHQRH